MKELSAEELKFIDEAARFFENPGRSVKLVSRLGSHIEQAEALIPEKARAVIHRSAQQAIFAAAKVAVGSLPAKPRTDLDASAKEINFTKYTHVGTASLMGAAGGFFGLAGLPLELSAVTVTMLRGIAEIADKMGFDPREPENQMQCLYVFSLGTPSSRDDNLSTSYYSSRVAFTEMIKQASTYMAGLSAREILRALEGGTAPAVLSLLTRIADQFKIRVTKKFLAQAAPIAGAVGGAAINAWFTNLFCECASYHFGLMRLEKIHGRELIQDQFKSTLQEIRSSRVL